MLLGPLLKLLNWFHLLKRGLMWMTTFPTLNARLLGWNASWWSRKFLSSPTIEIRGIPKSTIAKLFVFWKHVAFILVLDILMKTTRRIKISIILFSELSSVWACRSHWSLSSIALICIKTTFEKFSHLLVFHRLIHCSTLCHVGISDPT